MKFVFCIAVCFMLSMPVGGQALSKPLLEGLERAEQAMFAAVSNGDAAAFKALAGEDYLTINADGTSENLSGALAGIGKFKGSTAVLSGKQQRIFGQVAIRTGKATFYYEGKVAAEVLYTSGWVYRKGRWQFIHWQGTLVPPAGAPSRPG